MQEYYELLYYILPIFGLVITGVAQLYISLSYKKYKQILSTPKITGAEVARKILDKNNLNHVKIKEISGNLTDHYDPRNKTVNLSSSIYSGTSLASVAVSAHECGHAIQDKVGYTFMKIRSSLVPVVNFSTKIGYIVVMLGLMFGAFNLSMIGIFILMGILLFQLVTLPVEFNASKRAEKELKELNILTEKEHKGIKNMLKAAAFTYVAALLSTIAQILRLLLITLGNRNDDR